MILVTVGTNEQPFDRLVAAAARIAGDETLVVQHGSSLVPHGRGEWVDYVPFDELESLMRDARVVVCHAGVGSIMLARRVGHRPLVVPRRAHLGEAVDDHQLPVARRLAEAGMVVLIADADRLPGAIAAAGDDDPVADFVRLPGAASLAGEVRRELEGRVARRGATRRAGVLTSS